MGAIWDKLPRRPAMGRMTIRMPDKLRGLIEDLARVNDQDPSELVRNILTNYINKKIDADLQFFENIPEDAYILATPRGYRPFRLVKGKYVEIPLPEEVDGKYSDAVWRAKHTIPMDQVFTPALTRGLGEDPSVVDAEKHNR